MPNDLRELNSPARRQLQEMLGASLEATAPRPDRAAIEDAERAVAQFDQAAERAKAAIRQAQEACRQAIEALQAEG